MKYFLISDNLDSLAGMRMVGVDGVKVRTSQEMEEALNKAIGDGEIGLVLITSRLFAANRNLIFDYKLHRRRPLIIEMPDRHTGDNVAEGIKSYISEVVGIKI